MTPKAKFFSYTTEDTHMEYNFNVLIIEVELDDVGQDVLWWQSAYLAGKVVWIFSSACYTPSAKSTTDHYNCYVS